MGSESNKGGFTPGPWRWFGNAQSNSVYLATNHSGRRYVMDFVRWGMRGAQPRFQGERGIMTDAKDLLQFEVGDKSIVGVECAKNDPSVYRMDIRGVASADAHLIAAAPEMYEALREISDCLPNFPDPDAVPEDEIAEITITLHQWMQIRAAIARAEGPSDGQ